MPPIAVLRLNMTGMSTDPKVESERYRAALDMAEYCDRHGFTVVSCEEHHCAENGWLPSPLTMAAMVAARTKRVNVNVTALLVTLYDPIRLAEDIAVIDLASGGRFSFVAGSGYRPIEYHAMDKPWEERGALLDEVLETLLEAWKGKPFVYKGREVLVTPSPVSRPHPFFFLGGTSKAAARRAARLGIPFHPPMPMPELEAFYHVECERFGTRGFFQHPGAGNSMLFIDSDPERAWEELGPFFLRESREYASWKHDGIPRPAESQASTLEDLRATNRYEILSPEACRERLDGMESGSLVLHPLAGGIPVRRAWEMLETFVEQVWEYPDARWSNPPPPDD